MRRLLLIHCLALILGQSIYSQRTLEVLMEPFYLENLRTISTNGEVILATTGGNYLLKYNDIHVSRYNYPLVGGARLFYRTENPLASYNSSTYLVLNGTGFSGLYAFNGERFSRIGIPGTIVSGPVTFGGNLYILSRSGSLVRLYQYNGASVTEIPAAFLPIGGNYDLRKEGNHLYLLGRVVSGALPYIIKRFDGASTFTFPYFEFRSGLAEILPVGETGRVYFQIDNSRILYFNGTSIIPVFDGHPGSSTRSIVWRDKLYFLNTIEPTPAPVPIHQIDGSVVTQIPMPAGANVFLFSNLAVYNDALFVQVTDGAGNSRILRYDGSAFSDFFAIPGITNSYGRIFLREGNLMIQPEIQNGNVAYEYDGSTFTSIEGPADHLLASYLCASSCNHLWLMSYIDETLPLPSRVPSLVRERKPRSCSSSSMVIPRRFYEFERFDGVFNAIGDRECWSDLIVNWVIDPICPVPEICPPTTFLVTLSDAQDKIAWQQKFSKPTFVNIPLDGKLPFKTTLSFSGRALEDLILMDDDLIKKGIMGIGFSINAKEENFILAAGTRPGVNVPLLLTLLNKDGKEIWRKELKAPFITNIKDKIAEPGETLRFSVVPTQEETPTEAADNTSFSYLNTSHGSLIIDVKDIETHSEADLMITTILGQKLMSKRINTRARIHLQLPEYKPGLYVISIRSKNGSIKNQVVWLK